MSTLIRHTAARPRAQRGFTLVELMVAIVIGLLTVLVISQVLLFSEGQKRTTTSGADAQTNGALALYTLQREIQMAGYGFSSSPELIGCPIHAKHNAIDVATGAATPQFPTQLIPVQIDTTDAVRNSVRILASSKQTYSVPTRVIPPSYDPGSVAKRYIFPVSSSLGVAKDDLLLAVKDATTDCEVFQATAQPGSGGQIDRADNGGLWNPVGFPAATYGNGDTVVNLGQLLDHTYLVSATGTLQKRQFQLATDGTFTPSISDPIDVFPNIVNLQAYYGKDTNADGSIDQFDQVAPTNNAEWQQVIAIRVALVARSATYEKDEVTTSNPLWHVGASPAMVPAAATCGADKCVELKIDGLADWKHYRYKIFDTTVPLRNQVWKS